MSEGVDLLRRDDTIRLAFQLANAAMREQMLQSGHLRDNPGRRGVSLMPRETDRREPEWRAFQLGFQLLTLASTADAAHANRKLVDLIWFPTGGGKTEAYLAFSRRTIHCS